MTICRHLDGGSCRLASELAGTNARPDPTACEFCSRGGDPPMSINSVVVSIAIKAASRRRAGEITKKYRGMIRRTPKDGIQKKSKTVLALVFRYQAARRRWIKAGRPVRSDERVAELLAICQACEHGGKGGKQPVKWCGICGCRVNKGHFLNKLRWATEQCPKNPPNWANDR